MYVGVCLIKTESKQGTGREIDLCAPWPPTLPPSQQCSSLTCGALAVKGIDLVDACAAVQAGAVGALVCIDLTEFPCVTWPISMGGLERDSEKHFLPPLLDINYKQWLHKDHRVSSLLSSTH